LHLALGDSVEEIALPAPPNGHVPVVAELAESVLDSRPNCLPGREGIKATRIILAAQRSAREGRAVTL
jgi:predicted dehydrogenase